MTLAIISFFRNSAYNGQAQRFMNQAAQLRNAWSALGETRIIAVWGDCHDPTPMVLQDSARAHRLELQLIERSHGGPVFGSTEQPERFRALSFIGNAALEAVSEDDRLVWYTESDLLWSPVTAMNCLASVTPGHMDVVAPLIFAGENFYDVFSFRGLDGQRFAPFPPYHRELNGQCAQVSSVGSAFAMDAEVARKCRMGTQGVLIEFFRQAREQGFSVWVDPNQKVMHPC